jgi:hypothetical protein
MITSEADYKQKLARAEQLGALDPDPNSPEGRDLIALADELGEYERVHFPFEVTKHDIAEFRGGFPAKCSFCDREMKPEQLEPEEAGDWACWYCLLKWAREDDNIQEVAFWERAIKELECRRTP